MTGLAVAHLVREAYETVLFILLDSLEAIDARRLARLVDYFEEHADYLIVASWRRIRKRYPTPTSG